MILVGGAELCLRFKIVNFTTMECSFYQFKRKNECTECVNEEDIDPEETVNRLVGDFSQENGGNATNNAFRPWCYGKLLT